MLSCTLRRELCPLVGKNVGDSRKVLVVCGKVEVRIQSSVRARKSALLSSKGYAEALPVYSHALGGRN